MSWHSHPLASVFLERHSAMLASALEQGTGAWSLLSREWGKDPQTFPCILLPLFPKGARPIPFCTVGDWLWNAEAPWRCQWKASAWCKASCQHSRQRGNIPPRGSVHAWENASPGTASAPTEPWLSPSVCFHQGVSRLQQGVKNEVLRVTCQPSHDQVYKE